MRASIYVPGLVVVLGLLTLVTAAQAGHQNDHNVFFAGARIEGNPVPLQTILLNMFPTGGQGTQDVDAGGCRTWGVNYVRDDLIPAPSEIRIDLYWDASTVLLRNLYTGTEGALPASFSVCGTDNAQSGGTATAGIMRFRVRLTSDDLAFPYAFDTDLDEDEQTNVVASWPGGMRSRLVVTQYDDTKSDSHVYSTGVTTNEQIEMVFTGSVFNSANYVHTMTRDMVFETSSMVTNVGTNSGTFNVDNTYPVGPVTFQPRLLVASFTSSFACFDDFPNCDGDTNGATIPWTFYSTSSVNRVSNTVINSDHDIEVDQRLKFNDDFSCTFNDTCNDRVVTDFELYNRGETVLFETSIFNRAGFMLQRSMTFTIEPNAGAPTCPSTVVLSATFFPPVNWKYQGSTTVGTTCQAPGTLDGEGYRFKAVTTSTDNDAETVGVTDEIFISRIYRSDVHTQLDSTLEKDDFPNDDAEEDVQFISGEDSIRLWCHLKNARSDTEIDTPGNVVNIRVIDSEGVTVSTTARDTNTDGWTFPVVSEAAVPPTGFWLVQCLTGTAVNGNTWSDEDIIGVISAFTANREVLVWVEPEPSKSRNFTVWALTLTNSDEVDADIVPILALRRISPTAFSTHQPIEVPMFNNMTHDFALTSALWYRNVSVDEDGLWNVNVKAGIGGVFLRQNEAINVVSSIQIGEFDASKLLELAIWIGLMAFGMHVGFLVTGVTGFLMFFMRMIVPSIDFMGAIFLAVLMLWSEYLTRNKDRVLEQLQRFRR
jgi:hypothetical protein